LEALVDLGQKQLALQGMNELETFQRHDGAIPAYADVDWVCSTGIFQYSVIWYKLDQPEKASRAFNYAKRLQNFSGGFFGSYGLNSTYFYNQEISWAVKYFLDALWWKNKLTIN
jgi:malonyl-CoA O-methyltransferase